MSELERVAALIRERGIETVRVEFSDFHGIARGKAISASRLERVAEEGLQFALPTFALDLAGNVPPGTGVAEEVGYCDMTAVPDLATFCPVPWEPSTARVTADLYLQGAPLAVSPRNLLRQVVARYKQLGLEPLTGSELEFFVLERPEGEWRPYSNRPSMVYTMNPLVDRGNFLGKLRAAMRGMDIPVLACFHEFFPGQYEINLPHMDALAMADLTVTFKQMVKEMAAQEGLLATFMARPLNDSGGSGFHLHVSCRDARTGENAFYAPDGEHQLSPLARYFVAGQLAHAAGMTAVLAPTVNSYKRYRLFSFAPCYVVWGLDNRTTYVRIPPERKQGTRVENRAADGAANPYLVAAAILAAGLDGIRQQLDPGPPYLGDVYQVAPGTYPGLPAGLEAALEAMEQDTVLREVLGAHFVRAFSTVKRHEASRYRDTVTDWEFKEYSFYL